MWLLFVHPNSFFKISEKETLKAPARIQIAHQGHGMSQDVSDVGQHQFLKPY
jgi:hypothetical protein